jgi:hypothetical protein
MAERDWTEQEIYQAALAEWTGILAQLWTAIGKPIEPERLQVYRDQLGDVPLGLLERSIRRVLRENTWSNVPPIGTIWQAIRKELGDPYDLQIAIENWQPSMLGAFPWKQGAEHA